MSLAESLERAAEALSDIAEEIRPANGDPIQLLALLESSGAARVLAWLLANSPADAETLANEWLDEEAGAGVLSGLQGAEATDGLSKDGRKILRRILHKARSRGIVLDADASRVKPRVARLPKVDEDLGAGYVAPHDPRGSRLVYVVESKPSGGARVFEALIDEERGLVDFQVYQAGRRQVRDFIRDVTRRASYRAVLAEPEAVRELIARRAEQHAQDRPLPKAFGEWRGKLFKPVSGQMTPGEQVRTALGEDADADSIEQLSERVGGRQMGPWPPKGLDEALVDFQRQVGEARDAGEALSDEDLSAAVRERLLTLYAGESAPAIAERFEECAYLLWREDAEGQARAALATASAFRTGEISASAVANAMMGLLQEAILDELRAAPHGDIQDESQNETEGDSSTEVVGDAVEAVPSD